MTETTTKTKNPKFFQPTKMDPAKLVIIGLDTEDGSEYPRYDERVKLPLNEERVQNVMQYGVLQAVSVFKNGEKLELVLGRQRTRWAREANKRFAAMDSAEKTAWLDANPGHPMFIRIPVVVFDGTDDKTQYGAMISENEARVKDNAMVAARKMEVFLNLCVADCLSQGFDEEQAWASAFKQAATTFACSKAKIKQYQKLLNLDPKVQAKVESGELAVYEVLGLRNLPAEKQVELAEKKVENKTEGKKEKLEGDESRQLRATKKDVKGVAQALGGTAQLALLWAIGEISEEAASEDADFAAALTEARAKK